MSDDRSMSHSLDFCVCHFYLKAECCLKLSTGVVVDVILTLDSRGSHNICALANDWPDLLTNYERVSHTS